MNQLNISLKHKGKNFLLSVYVDKSVIVSDYECTTTELIADQLTIMKMVESEIKAKHPEDSQDIIMQLSHKLPMSIMNDLRSLR